MADLTKARKSEEIEVWGDLSLGLWLCDVGSNYTDGDFDDGDFFLNLTFLVKFDQIVCINEYLANYVYWFLGYV